MEYGEWAHGPFGPDAERGRTLRYRRTVLVIVHTVTAGTRLGDIVPMLEADPRIQVVFTHPESALIGAGTRPSSSAGWMVWSYRGVRRRKSGSTWRLPGPPVSRQDPVAMPVA